MGAHTAKTRSNSASAEPQVVMCLDPAALPLMLAVVGAGWVTGGRGTPKSRLWIGIPSTLMLLALRATR